MSIRKKIVYIAVVVVLMFSFCLQGCSIKKAETSYKVYYTDKARKRVTIELKADKSQGYRWYFYTETGVLIKSSTDLDRDDMFSDTRITKCTFTSDEELVSDTIVMVLVKDGDLDKGKAYIYPISYDEDVKATIGKMEECTVGLNRDVKAKMTTIMAEAGE